MHDHETDLTKVGLDQCEFAQIGGIPAVLKYLLEKGLLHGDCLTVTGTSNGRCPVLMNLSLKTPSLLSVRVSMPLHVSGPVFLYLSLCACACVCCVNC